MLNALFEVYRRSGRFALACPLLFLVPVVSEGAQHIVEWQLGMFESIAQAQAVENDVRRMIAGSVKTIALSLPLYWVARYFVWNDARRAPAWDPVAVRRLIPVLLWGAATSMVTLWGGPLLAARGYVEPGQFLGIALLVMFPLQILLAQWGVSAALGDPRSGWRRSMRTIAPVFVWAAVFSILATLPAMIVHYALNFFAMGAAPLLAAMLLVVDSVFVGYLAVVLVGINVIVVRRAEARGAAAPLLAHSMALDGGNR